MTEDKETIEVEGVRFSADEVVEVTIERAGRKIHINEAEKSRKAGFQCIPPPSIEQICNGESNVS